MTTSVGHQHVVFHRSAVKTNDNDNKDGQKKRKKKRKRRQTNNNCGTKEPKRVTEKKIEYQRQGKVIFEISLNLLNNINSLNIIICLLE